MYVCVDIEMIGKTTVGGDGAIFPRHYSCANVTHSGVTHPPSEDPM